MIDCAVYIIVKQGDHRRASIKRRTLTPDGNISPLKPRKRLVVGRSARESRALDAAHTDRCRSAGVSLNMGLGAGSFNTCIYIYANKLDLDVYLYDAFVLGIDFQLASDGLIAYLFPHVSLHRL